MQNKRPAKKKKILKLKTILTDFNCKKRLLAS